MLPTVSKGCTYVSKRFILRHITTRCLEFSENGDPVKVLRLITKDLRPVQNGDVRIKFLASSINHADINTIQGVYPVKPSLPAVAGSEGVAKVTEVGREVKDLKVGDWVLPASAAQGTWICENVVSANDVIKVRNDVSEFSLATIASPLTAYHMLNDFAYNKSRPVVQNGANSAVGVSVIQLAKEMGIKTINIVRDRPDIDLLKKSLNDLGADYVLTEKEFTNRDVVGSIFKYTGKPTLALNCVGGKSTLHLAACLDEKGKLISYGGMSKQPIQIPVGPLIFKSIELHGFWLTKWNTDKSNENARLRILEHLATLIKDGKLQAPPNETVRLDDYQKAIEKTLAGGSPKKQIFVFE